MTTRHLLSWAIRWDSRGVARSLAPASWTVPMVSRMDKAASTAGAAYGGLCGMVCWGQIQQVEQGAPYAKAGFPSSPILVLRVGGGRGSCGGLSILHTSIHIRNGDG